MIINDLRSQITELARRKIDYKKTIEEIDMKYKEVVLELYEKEGIKILGENIEYQKVYEVARRASGEINAWMLEYFTVNTNKVFNNSYDYEFKKDKIIIKFYEMEDNPHYNFVDNLKIMTSSDYIKLHNDYDNFHESQCIKKYFEDLVIPYTAFDKT